MRLTPVHGRSQTREYGNLRSLIRQYVTARGHYAQSLANYLNDIGSRPLSKDGGFLSLLRQAARNDAVMREVQDRFFEQRYFAPAMEWATENGFKLPLSALVIYDSFIHSGSMLWAIRGSFPERPPAAGGEERTWVVAYVKARHRFLAGHAREIVRRTTYRTECLAREIGRENWKLQRLPIVANGVGVAG